ncbi:MAG: RnfABCDGE type electron transport complex subunit G [Deltaproteobacteria bacterium]|nr:RnfABCDGE type electron transport complex subunit G [Deltaproteobacteria bacterium]
MAKIIKLGITLGIFCVLSAGLLAWVFLMTTPVIEANAKASFEGSLREVLPGAQTFKDVSVKGAKSQIYEGYADGKPVGLAVKVAPRGYAGEIEMLVGVDPELRVKGMKILSQRETPGLGTNMLKPKFIAQFIGKGVKDVLEPKKDIDALTGATISTRGVCEGVKAVLKDAEQYGKGKP